MKVALVYDRVNKWGGAERVLLALQELFPQADLYTAVYNSVTASWAKPFRVIPSFLQRIPGARKSHEWFAPLMPIAFETFSFDGYDLVISVTSEAAKGIITKPGTLHICYCLTPTRYLWSGYEEYFPNLFFRYISKPVTNYLKYWDTRAAKRPDIMVAISSEVKKRIKKYYDLDSSIIYPPVSLFNSEEKAVNNQQDFFLVVSRLVPYKRVDLAVKACTKLGLPLVVIGSGTEEKRLKQMAGMSVTFLGNLTDRELVKYYTNCAGFLFPGKEDFGISPVEAQLYGKPVIAFNGGGAQETIIQGKTGEFFDQQTVDSLVSVLRTFRQENYKVAGCQLQAKKFSKEIFHQKFMALVRSGIREHNI